MDSKRQAIAQPDASYDLALMLKRMVHNGDTVPQQLADYADHQWQRPSVQEWVAQARRTH